MLKSLHKDAKKPDLWENPQSARQIMMQISDLEKEINLIKEMEDSLEDLKILGELISTEKDGTLTEEFEEKLKSIENNLTELETKNLLKGEFVEKDAVITIHPGAGGTESQDWAEMLLRMYLRWGERHNFKYQINDILAGEEAGLKSVTFTMSGKNAYGLLEAENGIHRLVRLSPFDAAHRRHTSFASVNIIPLIDEDIKIDINPEDLRIDTYRSSSAGGQHVNVTDSAVRITHLPTGIVAQCQNERSQYQNKQAAMRILKSRLYEKTREEKEKEKEKLRGEKKDIGWGNQIRSYVLYPYQMIKDHRTDIEKSNVNEILDGHIDEFIEGYLKIRRVRRGQTPK